MTRSFSLSQVPRFSMIEWTPLRRARCVATLLATLGAAVLPCSAQVTVSQLRTFSLEELMGMEVSTVSRKAEPFYETAGAVAVLTGTDIQHTGTRTLAGILRYVPGMQVARVDDRTWAVTARGFNTRDSNKMLVLIDGRTVYSPLFSGVFWEMQDTFLPDLDRVEVIRGPGATMWGSNAVNGVVSFTTKDARYTQGGLITAGLGVEEEAFAGVRYGGEVPGKFYYRVYAQTTRRDAMLNQFGDASAGDWSTSQVGFRIDSASSKERGSLTVQGDYYEGEIGAIASVRTPLMGGNVLLRGIKMLGPEVELTTQIYFDYVLRSLYLQYEELRRTYDFDTQVNFTLGEHHEIVSGVNYRSSKDETKGARISFVPASRRIELGSAFIQDEIRWHQEKYGLIVGSKFEYHESVGWEIQPSIRFAVRGRRSTLWSAISRAVRTPSRIDDDGRFGPISGSRDFKSENVIAYELGYRAQHFTSFTWDVSLFYNDYDHLRSQEQNPPSRVARIYANKLNAKTYGAEVSLKWQPVPRWRLDASYTRLGEKFRLSDDSTDRTNGVQEANDPKNSASLRSHLEFGHGIEWDIGIRYVSELPNVTQPAYTATDTRIAWRFRGQWEFAVVGQNIFDKQHSEFGNRVSNQVQRSYYGSVTWEF